ncbi:MAG: 16S rRNA (uracil(1498)-N(3))-methyltransferase [Holophagales bacterium]|jgi:16S rRNA (uracil1498-N3)-methyltransferase|nr:16S rRNA (uracil(1498)-N(3))-methyltransferase [Holophagales bacterium]
MSLPRFILPDFANQLENASLSLGAEQTKRVAALRLAPGDSLEALLPGGLWRAELIGLSRGGAAIRLVCPVSENREAPIEIHACLPITAQLSLWDDFLPGVVELGAALIQPIIYERSQYDKRGFSARLARWRKIILAACEQSHRTRVPELLSPIPLEALQSWGVKQRWAAYEVKTGEPNPELALEDIAFTHGPEGGVADREIDLLRQSGWKPLCFGKSILRAVTCPAAILGAVQAELGRL